MKLWKKMVLLMMTALFISLGICIGAILYQTGADSIRGEREHYRWQLNTTAGIFARSAVAEELDGMSEVVKNSYLTFQFKRECKGGYALLKDSHAVINLTDYEIVNVAAMEERDFLVQKLGRKHVLLLKTEVENLPGYEILLAQDISAVYTNIGEQAAFAFTVYAAVLCLSGTVLVFMIRASLKPLRVLEEAAKEISRGKLYSRAEVKTEDEIGQVGSAFNIMAENVESRVDDLKLLLGALTHEIKTPMTAVIGYSDSLLNVNLSEEQKKMALQYIYGEGKRLEQLSGKMMSLLGLYENDTIKMEWVSAKGLFMEVRRINEPYLQKKAIILNIETEEERGFFVDRELMASLLGNLIRNGANASVDGENVYLRGTKEGIEVEDRGIGIPEEELTHVTKAFYMVDKSRSRTEGGSGLGLALCSRIAELHKAELKIESHPGIGTKVILILPDVYKRFTS